MALIDVLPPALSVSRRTKKFLASRLCEAKCIPTISAQPIQVFATNKYPLTSKAKGTISDQAVCISVDRMTAFCFQSGLFAGTSEVSFPDGFSIRAGVQHCRRELRAARVDKSRKEDAAGIWDQAMGKEHRPLRLTLLWARGRLCWLGLMRSFSATSVAGISPIERS